MTWTKDHWACEDCGMTGQDWGAPERCPKCRSENMTTDVDSVEDKAQERSDREHHLRGTGLDPS